MTRCLRTALLQSVIDRTPYIEDVMAASNKQKRIALPEEMVGIVLYLLSDASSYATSQDFVVDGGFV